MKIRLHKIVALLGMTMILVSCGLPLPQSKPSVPPNTPPASSPTLEKTTVAPSLVPSRAPSPVVMPPTPTYSPVPSPTSSRLNQSNAALRVDDLGSGFQPMDESSKEEMGLTTDALARSFEGIFRQAKPISSFAFLNPDPQKYEIVTGIVFYPLNASEVEAFDHMLDDSAATMLRFSQSFGGQAQPYPQMIKAGDRSLAWTFSSTSGQLTFKGEMIVLRQTDAVALLMTLNLADQKPALTVANLAPSFADYLKQALKP